VRQVLRGGLAAPVQVAAGGRPLSDALDDYERALIASALGQAGGNVAEAARTLQTDRANLYRRMRRLGLDNAKP
jgi:transcriptional regulator with GAF, ATPase, and Fis domain